MKERCSEIPSEFYKNKNRLSGNVSLSVSGVPYSMNRAFFFLSASGRPSHGFAAALAWQRANYTRQLCLCGRAWFAGGLLSQLGLHSSAGGYPTVLSLRRPCWCQTDATEPPPCPRCPPGRAPALPCVHQAAHAHLTSRCADSWPVGRTPTELSPARRLGAGSKKIHTRSGQFGGSWDLQVPEASDGQGSLTASLQGQT